MSRFVFFILLLIPWINQLFSQDNHYWSQQYGAVSSLMGGAMIAGVRDNSASYYNPGAITFVEYPNISVDANVYKLDKVYINDGAGSGINLNSAQLNIYPQIIGGMINYIKITRLKISYSILTRNFSNILMNARYTKSNAPADGVGQKSYLGEFSYLNQLNEQWFGICLGYAVKDKLGIGVTLFGIYRGQTSGIKNNYREITSSDSLASLAISNYNGDIKYMTIRMLAKFGLAWETGRWRFGLSLTTPSFGIYGNGSVRRDEAFYDLGNHAGSQPTTHIIMAENTSTKASYHHPLSVGIGIEYRAPRTRIAISAEYFSKITAYYIMKPGSEAFVYPASIRDSSGMSSKIEEFLYTGVAAKPVLNVSLGLDQSIGKKFNFLCGMRTDFTSYASTGFSNEFVTKTGNWDLYYVSTGLSYHQARQTMTIGFTYSFSPNVQIDPVQIVIPGDISGPKANAFAQSFGVVLGYTYYFPR